MAKKIIEYNKSDERGNIYWIIGAAMKALAPDKKAANEMLEAATSSSSYEDALTEIGKYVTLKEV